MELEDELGHYGNTSDEEWEEDNIEEYPVTTDTGTDPHSLFITVCCVFIFIFSIVGNIVVLLCYIFKILHWPLSRVKKAVHLWHMQIVISNLIFTLTLPFWAAVSNGDWVMGKVSCKVLTGMYCIGLYSCIYFQTFNAVYRFFLTFFFSFKTKVLFFIWPLIWMGIAIPSILEVLVSDTVHVGGRVHCMQSYHEYLPTYVAHYVKITVFFFVPLVVITISFVSVCIKFWNVRERHPQITRTDEVKLKTRSTIGTMFPIVLVFICLSPYNILYLLYSMTQHGIMSTEHFQKVANRWTHTVCHTLVFFHCCMTAFYELFILRMYRDIPRVFWMCQRLVSPSRDGERMTSEPPPSLPLAAFFRRMRKRIRNNISARHNGQRQSVEPRPGENLASLVIFRRRRLYRARKIGQKQSVEPHPHEGSDSFHQQEREDLNPKYQMQDLDHEPQNQTLAESPDPSHQMHELDHEPQNQTLAESPDAGIRP